MAKKKFSENLTRSIIKSITFRILIICSDSIIIYSISHRLDLTLGVIFFSNLASTILYFIHERTWNSVHWGRNHLV
ncbi:MAG: DUF2061 domain-containing protein [Candidatus Shapirobacteria bacterium]